MGYYVHIHIVQHNNEDLELGVIHLDANKYRCDFTTPSDVKRFRTLGFFIIIEDGNPTFRPINTGANITDALAFNFWDQIDINNPTTIVKRPNIELISEAYYSNIINNNLTNRIEVIKMNIENNEVYYMVPHIDSYSIITINNDGTLKLSTP